MVDKTISDLDAFTPSRLKDYTLVEVEQDGVSYKVPIIQARAEGLLVKPVVSTFSTTADPTTASTALVATDNDFGIRLSKTATANGTNNVGGIFKSIPVTSNWTATTYVRRRSMSQNFLMGGLCLRESATGRLMHQTLSNIAGAGAGVQNWGSNVSFNGETFYINEVLDACWLRIEKVAASSKYIFGWSYDNVTWSTPFSATLTSLFTTAADQIGFAVNSHINAGNELHPSVFDFLSYVET
jgi:hypothetical protein